MRMRLTAAAAAATVIVVASGVTGAPFWTGRQSGPADALAMDMDMDASSALAPLSYVWRAVSALTRHHPLLEARLVQACAGCQPYWTTELGKHLLFMRGIHFVDMSDAYSRDPQMAIQEALADGQPSATGFLSSPFPDHVAHKKALKDVFAHISEDGPRKNLEAFTAFRTRYYRSETGRESQKWLLSTASSLADTRKDLNITITEQPHSWGQNSIILHIPGASSSSVSVQQRNSSGTTIVGAHQDSTGFLPFLPAPGADDDGSGTVTLLEALRVLLGTKRWAPQTPVEFHWYSAEEGGLLGSQEVVRAYKERGANVKAMLQQDMTAFVKKGTEERVGLPIDFVNLQLRDFIKLLAKQYLDIPAVDTKLGWAASDHASWLKAGYASAFAIEAPFEDCNMQRIHSGRDTFSHDEFSVPHLLQFVRLTTSFVVELGGWRKEA